MIGAGLAIWMGACDSAEVPATSSETPAEVPPASSETPSSAEVPAEVPPTSSGNPATFTEVPAALRCPPHGPFETEVGHPLANVLLLDCDGRPHALHDLCPRRLAYVFEFADWSSACRDFAPRARALYGRLRDRARSSGAPPDAFEMFFVVSEDAEGAPAGAELCRRIRDELHLTMPVLYAPGGVFGETLGVPSQDVHLLLGPGDELLYFDHGLDQAGGTRIEEVLMEAWENGS